MGGERDPRLSPLRETAAWRKAGSGLDKVWRSSSVFHSYPHPPGSSTHGWRRNWVRVLPWVVDMGVSGPEPASGSQAGLLQQARSLAPRQGPQSFQRPVEMFQF